MKWVSPRFGGLCYALLVPGGGDLPHGVCSMVWCSTTMRVLGQSLVAPDLNRALALGRTGHATWSYNLGQPIIPLGIDNASLDAKNGSYLLTLSSKPCDHWFDTCRVHVSAVRYPVEF